MLKPIYNILVSFLGESKQGYYSDATEQYQFNCCRCAEENSGEPDGKHNLEILLSTKRGLKYHCWKCGDTDNMRGNLGTLIKRYGGSLLYQQYKEEINNIKKSRLYDINLFAETEGEFNGLDDSLIKLPKGCKNIDLSTIKYKKLTDYLKSRSITQDIIDKFNIQYTICRRPSSARRRFALPPQARFQWRFRTFVRSLRYPPPRRKCACRRQDWSLRQATAAVRNLYTPQSGFSN